jgi:hypothetical protein
VINEVATRGPGGPLDQFIEVMNPSRADAVDISGWQVHVFSSTNQLLQIVIIPEGTVLQPVGAGLPQPPLWVLASTAFTGGPVDQPGALVVDIPDNGGVGGRVAEYRVIRLKCERPVAQRRGEPVLCGPTWLARPEHVLGEQR